MYLLLLICHRLIAVLSFLLAAYALLSWFPGARESALGRALEALVEPLLRPFQRLNLQFSGLDFTVLAALLALQLLDRFLVFILVFILV